MSVKTVTQVSTKKPSWVSNIDWLMGKMKTTLSVVNGLLLLVNSESHYLDSSQAAASITNTGTVQVLTAISQGDTVNHRSGELVLASNIYIRGTLKRVTSDAIVRIILLVDKHMAGVLPTIGTASTTDFLQDADVNSHLNLDLGSRFWVLDDRVIALTSERPIVGYKKYQKLNHHISYVGVNAATANCYENQVLLCMISDKASEQPTIEYESRFEWHDN